MSGNYPTFILAILSRNVPLSFRAFYQRNRQFPTHIFLYRDGVGAGDIERVKEFELGAIKVLNRKGKLKKKTLD